MVDWNSFLSCQSVDIATISFTTVFLELAKQFNPNKLVLIRPRDKPWMNNHIRKLLRKRNRSYSRFRMPLAPGNLEAGPTGLSRSNFTG